jgi:FAD synthetase
MNQSNPSTKVVLASGVFDVIHPGHLAFLEAARKHGDRLVVVVTSDEQAAREKRPPRHSAADRTRLVSALDPVDEAFVGLEPYDLAGTVRRAGAAVIALGHDQTFDPAELAAELAAAGIDVAVVRCDRHPSVSTRELRD